MPWYRLGFKASVAADLETIDRPTAQRLFDKTKWLASNADNLRHEPAALDLPGLSKYSVGEWRIFYEVDRKESMLLVHAIIHRKHLT